MAPRAGLVPSGNRDPLRQLHIPEQGHEVRVVVPNGCGIHLERKVVRTVLEVRQFAQGNNFRVPLVAHGALY